MEEKADAVLKKKAAVPEVQAHVFYSGRVQGVGFRYTAERLALEQGLVGWVKNLADGRVELLCEGPRRRVEVFLKAVKTSQTLGPHIRASACVWAKPTGELSDFRVEFDV